MPIPTTAISIHAVNRKRHTEAAKRRARGESIPEWSLHCGAEYKPYEMQIYWDDDPYWFRGKTICVCCQNAIRG